MRKNEPKVMYSLQADERVIDELHFQDVIDALRVAVCENSTCEWNELDLYGTRVAYFEDRCGRPFELLHEPAVILVQPEAAVSNRPFPIRRKRLRPHGVTIHRFKPPIRRRARRGLARPVLLA